MYLKKKKRKVAELIQAHEVSRLTVVLAKKYAAKGLDPVSTVPPALYGLHVLK